MYPIQKIKQGCYVLPTTPPTDEQLAALEKEFDRQDAEFREAGLYDTPFEKLEKGLQAFCKEHKIEKVWTQGLSRFTATDDGAALKRAYEADPRMPDRPAPAPALVAATKAADATAALESGLMTFCKSHGIDKPWTVGLEKFKATPEGRQLVDAVSEEG